MNMFRLADFLTGEIVVIIGNNQRIYPSWLKTQ